MHTTPHNKQSNTRKTSKKSTNVQRNGQTIKRTIRTKNQQLSRTHVSSPSQSTSQSLDTNTTTIDSPTHKSLSNGSNHGMSLLTQQSNNITTNSLVNATDTDESILNQNYTKKFPSLQNDHDLVESSQFGMVRGSGIGSIKRMKKMALNAQVWTIIQRSFTNTINKLQHNNIVHDSNNTHIAMFDSNFNMTMKKPKMTKKNKKQMNKNVRFYNTMRKLHNNNINTNTSSLSLSNEATTDSLNINTKVKRIHHQKNNSHMSHDLNVTNDPSHDTLSKLNELTTDRNIYINSTQLFTQPNNSLLPSLTTMSTLTPTRPIYTQTRPFSTKNKNNKKDDDAPTSKISVKSSTKATKASQSAQDDAAGDQYQRMSQREHILLRPEPYIGSSECITDRTWVLTKPLIDGEDGQVVDVDFNFIPGLYKIFDEILVNAADNVHRNAANVKMSYIDIKIDPVHNHFSVENDGSSIPVVKHKKESIYVPELIFGHLLTSSNYDDTEARFTGGRHGFGAKLTNIFSKKFIVTIGDTERNVIYHQEFHQNMSIIKPGVLINTIDGTCTDTDGNKVDLSQNPSLRKSVEKLLNKKDKKNFTRIEFFPDLERFQVDRLTLLPTSGDVRGEATTPVMNANMTEKEKAQTEKARRSLQKKQLAEVLTKSDPVAATQTISSSSTDNNFSIQLHKSVELNKILQQDPYAAFPPFLLPLFERRVVDVVALMGNFGVDVSYNGKKLKTNTYAKYLQKCPSFPQPDPAQIALKKAKKAAAANNTSNDDDDDEIDDDDQDKLTGNVVTTWLDKHWFVAISQRPQFHNTNSGSQSLNQLSFVNSVATTRGGSHVHYVSDIIARYIVTYLNNPTRKKRWGLEQDVTLGVVKQFMCVFVSCYITNPSFDTQTKDTLITHIKGPQSVNPSKSTQVDAPPIPESFLKQVCLHTGIIQNIALSLQQRQHKQLQRKLDGGSRRVPRSGGLAIEKLDDALWAGTDRGGECTLILTEGDSAKALAVSGLSVLGRERFGVYPLKGKLLNVRDASKTSIANNKELVEIMQILGLKMNGNDRSHLRYGSVLVMADQDHDGSHIKGLLMNALHVLCPDLVRQQIHEVSSYDEGNEYNTARSVTDQQLEIFDKTYQSNIPSNLKLNTSQHHFVRLFVTPIVKATYSGADYPLLSLHRNLNYQQDLLDFQAKYGHLTPKQIDQLNATRKMLHQSRKDGEMAIEGSKTSKKKKIGMKQGDDDQFTEDDDVIDVISPPEQYNTTLSFGKQPQRDENQHQMNEPVHVSSNYKGKKPIQSAPINKDELPVKRINDAITVRGKVISFYSQFAYKQWWEKLPPSIQKKFRCKYYKGLGTSTSAEGKEYFNDLPSHIIDLLHRSRHDDQSLNLAFAKDHVDQRKKWVMDNSHIPPSDEYIRSYNKRGAYKNPSPQSLQSVKGGQINEHSIASKYLASRYTTINDFIHNELVQFSVADTIRSLPSTLDGFKPSQRKITYAALTKPLTSELRVSQFSAFVAERLVYHHGEQSLTAAIVNLAQDYPGTNNIPLLTGVGQFGTRHTGGKDHASARYIYTKIGPLTQELFPAADHAVLPQQTEEGVTIEPIHLLPILPLMIINGSSGIGTGFSTDIPAHNPLHVFQAVVQWLHGEPMRMIAPFNVGMSAQLYPQNAHKFNQSHYSSRIKTINSVDLAAEVQIPQVDAPWEVVPLTNTTNYTKKYSYDLSYGVNDIVQYGILGKNPSELYNSDELISDVVQFTVDNRPILNQTTRQLQSEAKKYRLENPTYGDGDFEMLGTLDSEVNTLKKLKKKSNDENDENSEDNSDGSSSSISEDISGEDMSSVEETSENSQEDDSKMQKSGKKSTPIPLENENENNSKIKITTKKVQSDDSNEESSDDSVDSLSDISEMSDDTDDGSTSGDDNNNNTNNNNTPPPPPPQTPPPPPQTPPPATQTTKPPQTTTQTQRPISNDANNGPKELNRGSADKPLSPLEKIKLLQEQLARMQQQTKAHNNTTNKSQNDQPDLVNRTTKAHTVDTNYQKVKKPTPLLDLSYLDRTDIAITKWQSHGKYFIDAHSRRTLHIVELPAGITTASYKKFLISLLASNTESNPSTDIVIDRIEERHTEQHVWFTIHCQQATIQNNAHEDILSKLRLTSNISLTNMHGFGADNNLYNFNDARIPLSEYCVERLKCYERRRAVQITEKWRQLKLSSNIAKFCTMIMDGDINLSKKTKAELVEILEQFEFDRYNDIYPKDGQANAQKDGNNDVGGNTDDKVAKKVAKGGPKTSLMSKSTSNATDLMNELSDLEDEDDLNSNNNSNIGTNNQIGDQNEQNQSKNQKVIVDNGYDYLLKIPIISATREKVKLLQKQMALLQTQVASLVHTTAKEMWLHELSILQPKLEQYVLQRHEQAFKHPFTSTPSYKSAIDGLSTLAFSPHGYVKGKNNGGNGNDDDEGAGATAKKASTTKKKKATSTSKKSSSTTKKSATSTAKKATTTTKKATTTTKKTAAKKTTAKKTTTSAKKTTKKSSTSNTRIILDNYDNHNDNNNNIVVNYTPFPSITNINMVNSSSSSLLSQQKQRPSVIPSGYNDEFIPQTRY